MYNLNYENLNYIYTYSLLNNFYTPLLKRDGYKLKIYFIPDEDYNKTKMNNKKLLFDSGDLFQEENIFFLSDIDKLTLDNSMEEIIK